MVLKPEAIRARLLKLQEVVSRLEDLQSAEPTGDFRDSWAIERGRQLASEVVFDIGNPTTFPPLRPPAELGSTL